MSDSRNIEIGNGQEQKLTTTQPENTPGSNSLEPTSQVIEPNISEQTAAIRSALRNLPLTHQISETHIPTLKNPAVPSTSLAVTARDFFIDTLRRVNGKPYLPWRMSLDEFNSPEGQYHLGRINKKTAVERGARLHGWEPSVLDVEQSDMNRYFWADIGRRIVTRELSISDEFRNIFTPENIYRAVVEHALDKRRHVPNDALHDYQGIVSSQPEVTDKKTFGIIRFHGTDIDKARNICTDGFRLGEGYATTPMGLPGIYLTPNFLLAMGYGEGGHSPQTQGHTKPFCIPVEVVRQTKLLPGAEFTNLKYELQPHLHSFDSTREDSLILMDKLIQRGYGGINTLDGNEEVYLSPNFVRPLMKIKSNQ